MARAISDSKDFLLKDPALIKAPILKAKKLRQVSLILGTTFLVIGIIGYSVFPTILHAFVQENLQLAEGKETYEKWKKTPIPITFKVHLFNVTNPREVIKGAKPVMDEVGPYVFKQYRSKDVLSWDIENLTVTYNDLKRYNFIPQQSANMSAKIYSLNLPLQGIIMFIKKLPYFPRNIIIPGLEGILKNYEEHLFSHRTARELLFDGYKVELIQDLVDLASAFVEVPQILPNNTFGFLYGKNNSGDGIFEVNTGVDDIAKYSQIVTWNNQSQIPFWKNEYCDMINGTDGSQFPPPIQKRDILYVYSPELCRSVFLEFDEDVTVQGIPAYRFVTPERLFASPFTNPDNMCYCTEPQNCQLSGILDVSPCRNGLKIAVTGPHFYQGHKKVQDGVNGLKPNKDLHETYVDVEPTTGIVLGASRKIQINFILDRYEEMEEFKVLPRAVVPLLWVTEEAMIDEKNAALFKRKVRTPLTITKSVLTACIVLGILWIVTAGLGTIYILVKVRKAASAVIKSKYKVVPQNPDGYKS